MQGLALINPELQVETIGFRDFDGQQLGVLLTPWFMNLVMLADDAAWQDCPQGTRCHVEFPSGPIEFTVSRDDELGCFLSAILFRSVAAFPDQQTAIDVAEETLRGLFRPPTASGPVMSRRDFFANPGRS